MSIHTYSYIVYSSTPEQAPQSHAQVSDAGTSSYVRRLTADTTLAPLLTPTSPHMTSPIKEIRG